MECLGQFFFLTSQNNIYTHTRTHAHTHTTKMVPPSTRGTQEFYSKALSFSQFMYLSETTKHNLV